MPTNLSTDLIVSDLDRSSRFYQSALGFQEVDRVGGPEGPFFAMLKRDGFMLMLETTRTPDPTSRALIARQGKSLGATAHLYLSIDDLTPEEKRLRAAGVKFEGPTVKPYGMKEVSFQDPDGYSWIVGAKMEG